VPGGEKEKQLEHLKKTKPYMVAGRKKEDSVPAWVAEPGEKRGTSVRESCATDP